MAKNLPDPDGLVDVLTHMLARATGLPERDWRAFVTIEPCKHAFEPPSNWAIVSTASRDYQVAMVRVAGAVRAIHPNVQWPEISR